MYKLFHNTCTGLFKMFNKTRELSVYITAGEKHQDPNSVVSEVISPNS